MMDGSGILFIFGALLYSYDEDYFLFLVGWKKIIIITDGGSFSKLSSVQLQLEKAASLLQNSPSLPSKVH